MGILSTIKKILDKPGGGRTVLGLLGSIYIFLKTGKFVGIFYDLAWGHRFSDAVLFDRQINWSLSPSRFIAETRDTWLVSYQPHAGDIIIDVGAGIGAETYFFSKAVGPTGKVISIEAHPETFKCLLNLCAYNKLDNVVPLNLAIQAKESPVYIDDPDSHIQASIVGITNGVEVTGTTLDLLTDKLGISEIAFIKMNIEGAEKYAVEGMVKCIRKARFVSISTHDFIAESNGRDDLRTKQIILEFFQRNGYTIFMSHWDPRGWIRDTVHGANQRLVDSVAQD
jgi:FkbM family methyltransferase